jgi:hypothetical protein
MGVGPRERAAGKVGKGTVGRRAKNPPGDVAAAPSSRRRTGRARSRPPVPSKRGSSSAAIPRRVPGKSSFRYRVAEQVLAAAAVTVAALAALTPFLRGSPGLFVGALAGTALAAAAVVVVLERLRPLAPGRWRHLLNAVVLAAAVVVAIRVPPWTAVRELRDLMARERATEVWVIAHQVYAAYRRMDLEGQKEILRRAEVYDQSILDASLAFGVGHELLMGIAATESSFHPRPSRDGGQGLFQITSVPRPAEESARKALGVSRLDPLNQKHNAFVAAATLAEYAERTEGDLFLTLLAYNIGPENGGLEFVMKRYGARNFAQVQPYLQTLPRDYPIRVLAGALAYRVWRSFGDLPRFEEGEWAARIRELGIPGLDGEARIVAARPG